MGTETLVNGLDVDGLQAVLDGVAGQVEKAQMQFRVRNRWIEGAFTRSRIKDFHALGVEDRTRGQAFVVESDEPKVLLGEDHAPNPVEYALHALAGCLTATLVYHAAVSGIQVEEVESHIEGTLDMRGFFGVDDSVRNGFNLISVRFLIKADAPREKLEDLVALSSKRSPVFDMASNGVAINVTLENN